MSQTIGVLALLVLAVVGNAADYLVYTGTYNTRGSKGIYVYRLEGSTGKLSKIGLAAESVNPTFLAVHPNQRYLYAVNNNPGPPDNTVSAFAIDRKSGTLTALNKVQPGGFGQSHLGLDNTGKWLAEANYGSGNVAILPVLADGKLGQPTAFDQHTDPTPRADNPRPTRAHAVQFSADNRFLLVANVGLERIFVYRFNAANGTLAPNDPPSTKTEPGSGPRHLALHKKGNVLYALNERVATVTAFRYEPSSGALTQFQNISALPEGFAARNSGAEIFLDRQGRFLYTSNRGHDSIAIFSVDPATYMLKLVENVSTEGRTPRNFAFDPSGSYLIAGNEASDSLVVFRVDPRTGHLTRTGDILTGALSPTSIVFVAIR